MDEAASPSRTAHVATAEEFQTLADNISQFAWMADETGWIYWYNRRWYDYTGTDLAAMQGWGWKAVHHPDYVDRALESFSASVKAGTPWEDIFPLRRADGDYGWFLSRALPIRGSDGSIVRWFGTNTDITEQRARAAQTQREAAAREAILAQLAEGMIVTDPDGKIIFVNEAATRLHGVKSLDVGPEDYANRYSLYTEAGEPYPSAELPLSRAVLKGETITDARWRIRRPDGTEVMAIGGARPFASASGRALGAVLTVRDDTARYTAEAALQRSEKRYRSLFESIDAGFCIIEMKFDESGSPVDWKFLEVNPAFDRQTGMTDVVGKSMRDLIPEHEQFWFEIYGKVATTGESTRFENYSQALGRWFDIHAFRSGEIGEHHVAILFTDISEQKRIDRELRHLNANLETRVAQAVAERETMGDALRQAQKMEAVGQLTGGIAHDFNNLLTIVTGNMDMLRRILADKGDTRELRLIDNALKGAERAASLTQRLLAFSRRQPLTPKPVNLDRLIAGMSDLLSRALGETIRIETVMSAGLWRVEVDANQLESALLNLTVNARDAMPDGGKLTIETANVRLDENYAAREAEVSPGQYVVIAVTDTGAGMARETLERVFEPFFTTKEVDKGTGLGLSMVYGFVKQSGGHIRLYSEPGEGTTVKIYLPRLHGGGEEAEPEAAKSPLADAQPGETLMVVEDDDDVRAYSVELLRELGYHVLEAHDGPSALRLLERQARPIDLLFTDVVMPGMSGKELADAARALVPGLRVLFTTGYARNAIVHGGRLDPGVDLIAKPFSYDGVAQKLREMLDRGSVRRVLLAEADDALRTITADLLRQMKFGTGIAETSAEVLGKVRAGDWAYDAVLLSESVAPRGMAALVKELRSVRDELPIMIGSATDAARLAADFADDSCLAVIAIPYGARSLREGLVKLGLECAGGKEPDDG